MNWIKGKKNKNQSSNMSSSKSSSSKKKKKMNVLDVLSKVPLFSGLSDDERLKLSKGLKQRKYQKDQLLAKQGEQGTEFFIISEGKVEVCVKDEKTGKKVVVAALESGDYAGEQALLQNTTRNATLQVVSDRLLCLVCDQKTFKSILANNTSIKFEKREAKRKAFVTYINYDDVKQEQQQALPEKTINWLLDCVEENVLFQTLNIEQRKNVLQHMKLITVKCGQFVINQGDEHEKASTFYVVESGEYDVLVDGVKVHHYKRGGSFGELALLHNAPRAASIVCVSDNNKNSNKLWEISRKHFRYALINAQKKERKAYLDFFDDMPIFKSLTKQMKRILNDVLEEERFVNKSGAVILNQGEKVYPKKSKFYIIKKGQCEWTKKMEDGTVEKGVLKEKQYFGEKAFETLKDLQKETAAENINENKLPQRAATVAIKGQKETILLSMDYEAYATLLNSVSHIIQEKMKDYERPSQMLSADDMKQAAASGKVSSSSKSGGKVKSIRELRDKPCGLNQLKTIGVLGKGGFGLVTLVKDPTSGKSYALKAIKKFQVIELELQKHIISEKDVMKVLNNKFLVNLHQVYNDKLRVYFLLDVCLGGELFTILRSRRYFNEPTARFFAASVVEGFAYMHNKNIIYRDLKPENLVLDCTGYLKIADFGFAKELLEKDGYKTYTLCGTPDYLCPEIVTGQGHGFGCDWWTVGILIYEMLASFPPFVADEPIETYRKIIRGRIRFPRYFSQDVRDLIRGLLHNKPGRRLGVLRPKDGGFREPADVIRRHPWFANFNWDGLRNGTLDAPIKNNVKSDTDLSNFQQIEVDDEDARPIDKSVDFGKQFQTLW